MKRLLVIAALLTHIVAYSTESSIQYVNPAYLQYPCWKYEWVRMAMELGVIQPDVQSMSKTIRCSKRTTDTYLTKLEADGVIYKTVNGWMLVIKP